MTDEWVLYVRRPDLARDGVIEDYQRLEATLRFNSLGSWVLDLHRDSRHVADLARPGWGIELVRDGVTVLSGPRVGRIRQRQGRTHQVTLSGHDEMVHLARRLAHPQPATPAPPYDVQEHDVRTGQASAVLLAYVDVNAGPGALPERRVPGLALAPDPGLGTTITGRARWQGLLDLLAELAQAGGGLGFRVRRSERALLFEVYQPRDLVRSVIFSDALGTLGDYTIEDEAPAASYVVVGGGGEGTERLIHELPDPEGLATWGRIEQFVDQRHIDTEAELAQAAATALAERTGRASAEITPLETPLLRYPRDYQLGDRVTAVIDGTPVRELIREVRITLAGGQAPQVRPVLDSASRATVLALWARLAQLESRLSSLERN